METINSESNNHLVLRLFSVAWKYWKYFGITFDLKKLHLVTLYLCIIDYNQLINIISRFNHPEIIIIQNRYITFFFDEKS